MPPKGWRKKKDKNPPVQWTDERFRPFGDRIDFLSQEQQHLHTGALRILPPKDDRD